MTNTQHTPGPWHVDINGEGAITAPDGALIARLHNASRDDLREANARLIAAAPDLLAALQAVADYWAGGDVPAEIDAAMRAAIAKATGQ